MAREFCKVCFDPRVRDLEKVLGRGVPLRVVARLAALPTSSLHRHWRNRREHAEKLAEQRQDELLERLLRTARAASLPESIP